ncbi:MAG: 50S ribosomal protein L23 [Phycisphaerales bacterium JB063]
MKQPTTIIKRPLVTEKSTWEASREVPKGKRAGQPVNRYAFVVDKSARKPEIRAAIQELYGVRVEKVATQIRKGKYFRTKFGPAKTSSWKKAVVQLHPDDRIDLF